jgi:hypothetical protein
MLDPAADLRWGECGALAQLHLPQLWQYAPSWLGQLPGAVDEDDRVALQSRVQGTTPTRMLRELAEALEALTAAQPLVLEDLHWSDASTVEALAMLARRREAAPLLVIGTYRPVELILRDHPLKAAKQELQLHGQCTELPLEYLNAAEVHAYLVQRLAGPAATTHLSAWVHQRTEGHPLFMVHAVDDLARQKQPTDAAAAEGTDPFAAMAIEVPAGLQSLIELQLGRLNPETQQVLEVASAVGVEFAMASVAAGLALHVEAIEELCEELARRGQFIADVGLAEWPDGTVSGRYSFRHALYREVLYRRIGSGRRVQLHRAVGVRLEVGYGAQASQLAAVSTTGQTLSRSFCLALLAEARRHVGHFQEGQGLLAEALAAFEASGRGDQLAEASRLQGELLLRQAAPDTAQAEACFQQALAIARRQQARSWELRAALSLARLRQHGKRKVARALLAPLYGWFTEGFDTADLQEAQTLLKDLS